MTDKNSRVGNGSGDENANSDQGADQGADDQGADDQGLDSNAANDIPGDSMKSTESTVESILRSVTGKGGRGSAAKARADDEVAKSGIGNEAPGPLDEPVAFDAEELVAAANPDGLPDDEMIDENAFAAEGAGDDSGFGQERMESGEWAGEPDLEMDDSPEVLQAKLGEAEQKAATYWERLLRMQADMDNQRKRAQKDVENARKFALEGIANDLLPVKDSLEMGLVAASEEDADMAKIVEGSDLTLKMLSQALEKYKIIEINPVDEKFNPELHQAMSSQPAEGVEPNTVVAVLQKGYTLNERLIRPALVMIAK